MPVLLVLALTIAGLMVGVEVFVAVFATRTFDRLPAAANLTARADSADRLGRAMPGWYIVTILLTVLIAVLQPAGPGRIAAIVATALFAVSIVMSVTLLVPINNRARRWTPDTAPADWRASLHRWDRLHQVRTLVIVVGFAALATAAIS